MIRRCPTCRQPMPNAKPKQGGARICVKCKKPIERHHKFEHVTVRGLTTVQHRHCDHPFDYVRPQSRVA